jgi:class 3 adenylate cyclase
VTFLFTDVEDSSRLWEDAAADMADSLRAHDAIVRGAIERHGGAVFGDGGDGFRSACSATCTDPFVNTASSSRSLRSRPTRPTPNAS